MGTNMLESPTNTRFGKRKNKKGTVVQYNVGKCQGGRALSHIVRKEARARKKGVKVVGTEAFPYLDMEMRFNENKKLCFGVHTKPGFQTKYLDINSHHASAQKKALVRGVSIRLAGLTTRTADNQHVSLSTSNPKNHAALKAAGHLRGKDAQLPKLSTILDSRTREKAEAEMKKTEWNKDAKRTIFIIKKYEGKWRTPIHVTLKKLREKYGLKWFRYRILSSRHSNLKEKLLGDLSRKVMRGVEDFEYVKKIRRGKCTCVRTHKPNGECMYKEECETKAVIYKITCKCCDSFYIGKTARSLKQRCQEHYQGLGKFYDKRKCFYTRLEEDANPSITPPSSQSSRSSRLTRSQPRSQLSTPQHNHTPTSTPINTGITYLTALLSDHTQRMQRRNINAPTNPLTSLQIQPSIQEEPELESSESNESDESSTANPKHLSYNHPHDNTNQAPNNPANDEDPASDSENQSQSSFATFNNFADAFAGFLENGPDLEQLERDRAKILSPMLESDYSNIECSNITRHMWSHLKDMQFATKKDMYAWVRNNWEVDILTKMPITSAMKTAGTRHCQLCMKERMKLFYAFYEKQSSHKLINSRNELYAQCTCKTRFLRLSAVGNAGADEATS